MCRCLQAISNHFFGLFVQATRLCQRSCHPKELFPRSSRKCTSAPFFDGSTANFWRSNKFKLHMWNTKKTSKSKGSKVPLKRHGTRTWLQHWGVGRPGQSSRHCSNQQRRPEMCRNPSLIHWIRFKPRTLWLIWCLFDVDCVNTGAPRSVMQMQDPVPVKWWRQLKCSAESHSGCDGPPASRG